MAEEETVTKTAEEKKPVTYGFCHLDAFQQEPD